MHILQAKAKRPLDVLAVGAGGHVAAASSAFGVRGDVDVWAVASGRLVHAHQGGEREVSSLAFHPDGRHLLVGEQDAVRVVDTIAKAVVADREAQLGFPSFALSRDGSRLLVTSSMNEAGAVECWAVTPEVTLRQTLWSDDPEEFLRFGEPAISPDGTRVAVSVRVGVGVTRNTVTLRDAATGRPQAEFDFDPADPLLQLAFSADGTKLLARYLDRVVKVFDAATGQPAGELVHPGRPYITGMAVHPNGTLACSRNNGAVCFWNLTKGELVRTLDWKLGKLVSVAFAPDGNLGAAGTEDGQVVVWDVDE
jgi:WD40 repeat protein